MKTILVLGSLASFHAFNRDSPAEEGFIRKNISSLRDLERHTDYFDDVIKLNDVYTLQDSEKIIDLLNKKVLSNPHILAGSINRKMTTQDSIKEICEAMKTVLLEKNKRYGDSAISPKRRFSKLDGVQGILIRLDDKMNRIEESSELRTNDICDMIGYLSLLLIAKGATKEEILKLID